MKSGYFIGCVYVVLSIRSKHAKSQQSGYFVCKAVSDVFVSSSHTPVLGARGPPGKSGPMGIVGPTGPKGERASIDWNAVDQRINSKIHENRICNGIAYEGRCIQFLYTSGPGTNRPEAVAMCSDRGARLADLDTKVLYDLVFKYVQRVWNGYTDHNFNFVELWVASSYNRTSGLVFNSNGDPLYKNWFPGYPTPNHHFMAISIPTTTSRKVKGMFNVNQGHDYPVPLCSFPI